MAKAFYHGFVTCFGRLCRPAAAVYSGLGSLLVRRFSSTDCGHEGPFSLTEKPYFSDDESTSPFTFVFTYEAKAKRTTLPRSADMYSALREKVVVSLRMAEACLVAIFSVHLLDSEFTLPTNV